MNAQQEFGKKFEDYLLGHMTKLGMGVCRNPKLNDDRTPDFLVKHIGRTCYVEATHIEEPGEFRDKRGETDLIQQLEKRTPEGWRILLNYAHNEDGRLSAPISKNARGITEIVARLSENQGNPEVDEFRLEV